jgi:transcription termination/antitermination protein NusA
VPDDQLSLAIGKEGQNARLAARLTGWRVDIRSETEFAEEEQEMGYEDQDFSGRCAAILSNGKRCPNAALPGSRYCGLPAHQALADQDGDEVAPAAEAEVQEVEVEVEDALAGTTPDEDAVPVAEVADVEAEAEAEAPGAEAAAGADGSTDLGPDGDDPGTPSGAADSAAVPDGASIGQEPEFAGSDPDGEYEASDSDPIEQRLEER